MPGSYLTSRRHQGQLGGGGGGVECGLTDAIGTIVDTGVLGPDSGSTSGRG